MADLKKVPTNIRLRSDTLKLLEPLAEAGLNVSEIANAVLLDNLNPQYVRKYLERQANHQKKVDLFRKALAAV